MSTCSRCGYAGTADGPACPRCGQPLSQPAPARPTLILRLDAPSLPSREWEITDSTMEIGRLDDSDIAVPDKSVSRQHARILPTPTGFDIEDLGSTNGTLVNDRQISDRTHLNNGDRVLIGDVPLVVVLKSVQPVVVPPPPPPPPPNVQPSESSTVFYAMEDAPAVPQPQPSPPPPAHPVEAATALDITPAKPSVAPVVEQPTLVADEPSTPAAEPIPAEPVPEPAPEPGPAPPEATEQQQVPSALGVMDLADRLATALRALQDDTRQALARFEAAGGESTAQAFIRQSAKADANPDDPIEQARLLGMASKAARLLEAAMTLASAVSSLHSAGDEPDPD